MTCRSFKKYLHGIEYFRNRRAYPQQTNWTLANEINCQKNLLSRKTSIMALQVCHEVAHELCKIEQTRRRRKRERHLKM